MTEHGMVTKEHLSLTISFDHDLVDGAPAARFLRDFTNEIEEGRMLTESRPNTR
jgi:pyruvate/2-oxoglutarate dehydrogenase complex dihydrolipoamide acyltransferase (E2) component